MYTIHTYIRSSLANHLSKNTGYFHVLAIVNNAAMNIQVHILLCFLTFVG